LQPLQPVTSIILLAGVELICFKGYLNLLFGVGNVELIMLELADRRKYILVNISTVVEDWGQIDCESCCCFGLKLFHILFLHYYCEQV